MTTGTITRDSRTFQRVFYKNCFEQNVYLDGYTGSYYKKDWAGGDSPSVQPNSASYDTFTYQTFGRNGEPNGVRHFRVRKRPKYPVQKTDNPYDMSLTVRLDVIGNSLTYCGSGKYSNAPVFTNGYPCYAYDVAIWNSNDSLSLIGRLTESLNAGFNLAVFLGEGKEALATIAQSATRIYRAAKEVKKGRVTNAANILLGGGKSPGGKHFKHPHLVDTKDFASNWLQLQYGWLPLIKDVFSAAKHLAYMQDRPFIQTYRVRMSRDWANANQQLSPGSDIIFGGSKVEKHSIIAKVTSVNEAALLGLTDPSAVVWEMMPYSFVFDWFIPVGNYLEAINLRGSLTATYILSTWITGYTYSVYSDSGASHAEPAIRYTTLKRDVTTTLPVPLPTVKRLDEVVSWKHAANGVALVTQFVLRNVK